MTSRERLLQMICGYTTAQVVATSARLGIADLLTDGPRTVDDLAIATDTHAPSLRRLLRALAGLGVLAESEPGRFELTSLGIPLRADEPDSVRELATMICGDASWRAWGELPHSITSGEIAFEHIYGVHPFEYYGAKPELAQNFNAAMADHTRYVASAIIAGYDFSAFRTLIDVGGGNGSLMAAILSAHRELRGVVFDTPPGTESAPKNLAAAQVNDRCEVIHGDFFESVPAGDAYILKSVIHDWDDERSVTILGNCRRAMSDDGRVLLIEALLPAVVRSTEAAGSTISDLNMLVNTGGRERTEAEYAALLDAAGFRLSQTTPPLGAPLGMPTLWTIPLHVLEGVRQ